MNAKTKALSEEARRGSPGEPRSHRSGNRSTLGRRSAQPSRGLSSRRAQSETLRGDTQEVPRTVTIRFVEAAEAELDAALGHYESESPGLGAEFLVEVISVVNRIAEFPDACQELESGFAGVASTGFRTASSIRSRRTTSSCSVWRIYTGSRKAGGLDLRRAVVSPRRAGAPPFPNPPRRAGLCRAQPWSRRTGGSCAPWSRGGG